MTMLPSLPTTEHFSARMPPQGDQLSGGGGRRKKPRDGEKLPGEAKRWRRLSDEQVSLLETSFGRERKPGSGRKAHLASELGLEPRRVAVWFQNRRARWKSRRLEEEYGRLKCLHDGVVLHQRHLEAEVLRLKEQLSEAEEEIRKLSAAGRSGAATCREKIGGSRSSSSSSSFAHRPLLSPVPDLAGAGEGGGLAWVHGYSINANMDWLSDHDHLFV